MSQDTGSDRLRTLFEFFDQNGDGQIDRGELLSILQSLDEAQWNEDRVDQVLEEADLNKDSRIQYDEFVAWIIKKGDDQDFFRQIQKPVPEEAINGLVRQLSNMSEENGKTDLVAPLKALHDVPWEKKEPAIALLLKLLQNVVKSPDNPKFRKLKRTNATLQAKVFSVPGCAEVLFAAGFEAQGDELVLPDSVDVQWVVDELTSFGNEELMAQKRAERDARIAALKAEEGKSKQLTGKVTGGDAEERRKMLELIEYDRQERLAREKLAAEGYREQVAIPAEKGGGAVTRFSDVGVDVNRGGG